MKHNHFLFLLLLFFATSAWTQELHPFQDDVESNADFDQNNLNGWTSLDLDGLDTAGSFHEFPGKGGPLGFIVYTPDQTDPRNDFDEYAPRSGRKYFASISSYDGPVNDWLISNELAAHPGGTFSFYAKSSYDFMGEDEFKVAYSTTTSNPEDFIFLNNGNTIVTTTNWRRYEFDIPQNAKHIAINGVSQAVMLMIDDLQFAHHIEATAPGSITNLESTVTLSSGVNITFNWTNPTVDADGSPLNDLVGIKVYRGTNPMDFQEIADLSATVGQSMTYSDLLSEEGSYIHRFVGYNAAGNGILLDTQLIYYGLETVPGAPRNITFTQNQSLQNEISWNVVDYGQDGGILADPVAGYTVIRSLGNVSDTLVTMHPSITYTETDIPDLNLYTYTIIAQIDAETFGIPGIASEYSGLNADQVSVTTGTIASEQAFELNRTSIISQSIYTPDEIGNTGLITAISYTANLGSSVTSHYKIYASTTQRAVFGTDLNNAVWEYFGNQKLLFDGEISFPSGRNAVTVALDQPFYYDANTNENVVITIVKPLVDNPPYISPANFSNTSVEGMRTYYAIGYSVDLSTITTQPAAWSTEEVPTIPSIALEKKTNYGTLSGEVTLTGTGTAIENVLVTLTPDHITTYQNESTTTDENGNYQLPALLPGNYTASFTKDGYNTVDFEVAITASEDYVLDVELEESIAILISGTVSNTSGQGIEGVQLNLSGFSEFTTSSDMNGDFVLEAYADKNYDLEYFHPLYDSESISFTSQLQDYTIDNVTLTRTLHKPNSVVAENNEGVGEVSWRIPNGYFDETQIGWGTFIAAGDAWGNGGEPFMAGIRLEPSDLENQISEGAELTHVRAYIANNAEIIVRIFKGANAEELIHSQEVSIPEENWYDIELSQLIPISMGEELWIGIDFIAGQYGSYPIGLDDGPNAPSRKGSMLYENGVWTGMSLTNKNWNIYGITNHTMDTEPLGYKVYRSPASSNDWIELTTQTITDTTFTDTTLENQAPGMYVYGITATYDSDLDSEKAISNAIENQLFFDYTIEIAPDSGHPEGTHISIYNEEYFHEAFIGQGMSTVAFPQVMRGNYTVRVELDYYQIEILSDITVEDNATLTIPLSLLKVQPANLTATGIGSGTFELNWTLHETHTDEMEKYPNFEKTNIGSYILRDMDGLETYTYTNFTFPGAGDPMAYIIFNPQATTPAVTIDAYSGQKFLAGFAGPSGPNNDWIIIPAGSGTFSFMAQSLERNMLERMRVLYSTTGNNTSDFTPFEGIITVPNTWSEYSFEAPEETKYVAINYISNDSYILKIDDLTYEKEYDHALSYTVYLNDVLLAEGVETPQFLLEDLSPGRHVAEVEAVYPTGVSEKTEVIIDVLNVDTPDLFEFKIYPNPSAGIFNIELNTDALVSIYDLHGRRLYTKDVIAGKTTIAQDLSSGTYIIEVKTSKGIATKKLVIK